MSNDLKSILGEYLKIINEKSEEKIFKIIKFIEKLNNIKLPQKFNWVSDFFEEYHVKEHPSRTALIWYDIDKNIEEKYSYIDIIQKSNKLLNFLRKYNINKGDPLYIMMPTLPEQWITFVAIIKGGIVGVPNATNLTPYELKYRFSELRPRAIIADEASAERIDSVLPSSSDIIKIIVRGKREGWISYEKVEDESNNASPADTSSEDESLNYFTSGTTGMPKRVIHTAISYPIGHISTATIIGLSPDDLHLNLSAPGWAKFAWSSFFSPFIVGSTVLGINYSGKLDPAKYLEVADSYNITSFCAPPTAWRQFIILDLKQYKFDKLRNVVSAGEPLNPEIIKVWKNRFGNVIRDFYGQTETTAMIGNLPNMEVKPGSFGKPIPMYDIVLLDDQGNEITRPYEIGHIAVRLTKWRPIGLFRGYSDIHRNEEAFKNGYYFTGDKAYFDENGYWYFVGRADDVIKTSDYRVGPFEVESALLEHPAVAEAAVIGSPDPVRWQVVKAFVVLKPGYEPSEKLAREIFEFVKKLLPSYKVPRIIEFVNELPKTISGKIRRNELRRLEEERKKKGEISKYEFIFK
ncbi:MAG: acyl--CoA ligase [Sulfolobaceae archaeon]